MLQNMFMHMMLLSGGGPFNAVTHLANEYQGPVNTACLAIAGLMVIVSGGMYIIGTPKMRQFVKSHIVGIFIGVLLVMGGKEFIDWLASDDKSAWGSTILPMASLLKARLATIMPAFSKWLL